MRLSVGISFEILLKLTEKIKDLVAKIIFTCIFLPILSSPLLLLLVLLVFLPKLNLHFRVVIWDSISLQPDILTGGSNH